jgi:hypothetical protein
MDSSNFDYAIFGSSRCMHFIQPKIIKEKTKQDGLNLACVSCGPLEVKLMVQEFLNKHSAEQIFIQVDNSHNIEEPNYLSRISWMPYINEPRLYKEFEPYGSEYYSYKNIPFYRYQKFGPKIGFRNTALILKGKEGNFISTKGFTAQFGNLEKAIPIQWEIYNKPNKHIQEIIKQCSENAIKVHFFTSPVYDNQTDMSVLEGLVPNYTNLSASVSDKKYFRDNTHLNEQGSEIFTEKFIEKYLD